MPRRLPLCARCGKSMKGTSRVVLGWDGVPGKPSLGWHMYDGNDCLEKDRDAGVLLAQPYSYTQGKLDMDHPRLVAAIREIERRGAGRVVANKAWDAALDVAAVPKPRWMDDGGVGVPKSGCIGDQIAAILNPSRMEDGS